jgi:hypothetical protein
VEDIHPEGGGVVLDRDGNFHGLEGVHELEDELGRLKEVLNPALGWVTGAYPT